MINYKNSNSFGNYRNTAAVNLYNLIGYRSSPLPKQPIVIIAAIIDQHRSSFQHFLFSIVSHTNGAC